MTNETQNNKTLDMPKFFVNVVGIAAAIAVVLIGVKGEAPTTFLGGLALKQDVSTSRLYITTDSVAVQKGRTFAVDIVLESGTFRPSEVTAVLKFDPEVLEATYVDLKESDIIRSGQKQAVFDNKNGTVRVTGELPEIAKDVVGTFAAARVYFRASQEIGTTELSFVSGNADSNVVSGDSDGNVLSETDGATVEVTLQ